MIFHFSIIQVHFVFCFLNFFVLFPYLVKYYNTMLCLLLLYFEEVIIGRRDFLLRTCPLLSILMPSFLPSSSVPLAYFILPVLMRECLGKHSRMSSPFPLAILNDACSFLTVQLQVHNVYSERKTRNC